MAELLAARFNAEEILYDKYHRAEFAQDDLVAHLTKLYRDDSHLIVAVLCPDYEKKEWCGLEWKTIRGLLKQGRGPQIMLTRFARVEPDALEGLAGYVDLDTETPETAATLILERLALNEGHPKHHYIPLPQSPIRNPQSAIPHNLPRLQSFFGRTAELQLIRDALHPDSRTWGALIDGPGGMGKTSLAIRAAYDCPAGQFDRIIFTSVKERELDDDGLRYLDQRLLPAFLEMLNELARELGQPELLKSTEADRPGLLLAALRPHKILLILDNLESLTKGDRDQLFTFIKRLPAGCKAILTSRRRLGSSADTLILEKLDQAAALATLADLARRNPLLAKTNEAERIVLYTQTGGKPLLLRWVAGQIGRGSCRTFTDALTFLRSCPPDNDPLEFVFGDLAVEFTEAEKQVLVALTYFTQPATVAHITTVATAERRSPSRRNAAPPPERRSPDRHVGTSQDRADLEIGAPPGPPLDEPTVKTALATLANRSLVLPDTEEQSYTLVPLVADFLRRKFPDLLAATGQSLAARAYALIVEKGYKQHDRFPLLDAAWPTVAPAIPLFVSGPNPRLQTVCDALQKFLEFTGRWDEWRALSLQAEAKAVAVGDYVNAGWRACHTGWVHLFREEGDEVLSCAGRASAHWTTAKAGVREQSIALQLRGVGHQLQQDYPDALADARAVVELRRSLAAESEDVAIGLNDVAGIESVMREFPAAERDLREALRIARAVGYAEGVAYITGNLAELALDRDDCPGAEALAREALPLSEKVGRKELIAGLHHHLATTLVRQGQKTEALPHAQQAVALFTQLGSPKLARAQATLQECQP